MPGFILQHATNCVGFSALLTLLGTTPGVGETCREQCPQQLGGKRGWTCKMTVSEHNTMDQARLHWERARVSGCVGRELVASLGQEEEEGGRRQCRPTVYLGSVIVHTRQQNN